MVSKGMEREVSGWYSQEEETAEERAARMRATEEWYEKRKRLNYRTVPLEIPGKMMLALGEIALREGISFSEFIEGVLDSYLKQKKIHWRSGKLRS